MYLFFVKQVQSGHRVAVIDKKRKKTNGQKYSEKDKQKWKEIWDGNDYFIYEDDISFKETVIIKMYKAKYKKMLHPWLTDWLS